MANRNYRQIYKDYYKIDFDKSYVVHHIDGNRDNNKIDNLLLLPFKLHSKYHFQKSYIENNAIPTIITGSTWNSNSFYWNYFGSFAETMKECNKWYDYKLFLEGILPNIHGISI